MPELAVDESAIARAAQRLKAARRILIVTGGGAQDAASEVTALSQVLQAPVFAHRRGRGVLDGRSPFAVTLPLARELWGEADVVLGIGTRLFHGFHHWGVDDDLAIIRVDADPDEPDRFRKADVALVGDARPILRRLIDALDGAARPCRHDEMVGRQAAWRSVTATSRRSATRSARTACWWTR
jgi:acetolactate synthase-1/2/3 large subunit